VDIVSRDDKSIHAIEMIRRELPNVVIKPDEPLANHTTFKVGGPVFAMLFPESTVELTAINELLRRYDISPFIIGNGSNILASDKKHDLIVLKTSNINNISLLEETTSVEQGYRDITVDTGVLLSKAAEFAYENELTGLEFAHGIPGSAGGAVVMNAGAYGREMKDVVYSTTVYSTTDGKKELTAEDNDFSYRKSRFLNSNEIVLSTVLRIKKGNKEDIGSKMDEFKTLRQNSQPLDFPSGGSTFKRPKEGYAAVLIEQAGLRGYTIGGAQVSEKHTGFIVNKGNASFKDIKTLIEHVQETVLKQFGIDLDLEVKILG